MKYNFIPEAFHIPCIYKIHNTYNNKYYIGQTGKHKKRWLRGHSEGLRNNKHHNPYFQNDFNKCFKLLGHTNFLEYSVIEFLPYVDQKSINDREFFWMNEYKKTYELYNLVELCDGNIVLAEETRKKISVKNKAYFQTEEGKALIVKNREAKLGKTYEELHGEERAVEIRKLISDHKIVEMNKPEVKQHLSEMHMGKSFEDRFGKEHAEQILEKMSVARKGKYTGKDSSRFRVFEDVRLISNDGKVYTRIEGIKEFAEEHGLSKNHLCELLAGKRKSHKGWTLE